MLKLKKIIFPKHVHLLCSSVSNTLWVPFWYLFCSCSPVLPPAPRRHPCPQRHCKSWLEVTGEEQVSSITSPCLGSAISLLHLRVSMEETKPPPPPSRYPSGGSNLQTKPSAERVMTLHLRASIMYNEPAWVAACQHLNTKRCQANVRNNQTTLLPKPHSPCGGWKLF